MTLQRFRKKPVVVAAVQWTGDNELELAAFTGNRFEAVDPEDRLEPDLTGGVFDELHSTWVGVRTGQWVVRGVKREFYPIDEAVLAETYERVVECRSPLDSIGGAFCELPKGHDGDHENDDGASWPQSEGAST